MSLRRRCRDAADQLESVDFLRIFSDDDADGIAAAGILTRALDRAGIPFHLTLDRLHADHYERLDVHDAVLLLDQGSGELDLLARHPGTVLVVDHHKIRGRAPHALHVNPHLEGIDGTSDACTAALALLVALELDEANAELAPIAMAGIVGDRQHVPELRETNRSLANRVLSADTLSERRGLPFRLDVSLAQAMAASVDPFLVDVSGTASKTKSFLEELGIDPSKPLRELDDDAQQRLASAVVAHLLAHDVEPRQAEEVAGTRWAGEIAGHTVTAGELSAMFNACAREERPSLGVAIAHGDADALEQARGLVEAYQEDLLTGLVKLHRDPPETLEHVQVFEALDPDLVGAHCGLGMTYVFDKARPALGLKTSDGNLKVSARGTQALVDDGLDLSEAMAVAADEHDGNGGGHPIAAGAMVPLANRDAFLDRVDEIVGDQLHATATA